MNSRYRSNDDLDLAELLSVLIGGKWIIFVSVACFLTFSMLYLKLASPVYIAKALIQVEQKPGGIGAFNNVDSFLGGETKSNVEVLVMRSRYVLADVVTEQSLQITLVPKYMPYLGEYLARIYEKNNPDTLAPSKFGLERYNFGGAKVSYQQLFIADDLSPRWYVLKVKSGNNFQLQSSSGHVFGEWQVGDKVEVENGRFIFQINELIAREGMEFSLGVHRLLDASGRLAASLAVAEKVRQTGVIELGLEGTDKEYIKRVLSAVVGTYKGQNVRRYSEEAERSIVFLEDQIPSVRQQLEKAEQALNEYRIENGSLDMGIETKAVLNQITKFDDRINQLKLKETEVSSRYNESHPVYITLLEQIEQLKQDREAVETSVGLLPQTQQELLRLNREVQVTGEVYLQLLNKMEELKILRAGTVGNVRILEQAEVGTYPIKPNKNIVRLFSVFLGVLFGISVVVILYVLNPSIKNPSEVQHKLGITNYGVVPKTEKQAFINKSKEDQSEVSVLAALYPKDLALESVRSIRTSLHFAMMEAQNNIVMLTGPSPGVGKSFISTNLAALVGESEQKVLLIDADLRKGHINKSMNLPRAPGLSDMISKPTALDEVLHSNVLPNVDFLSTGEIPPNPSELLMSKAFTSFLDDVSKSYDLVLIDTPPVLAVTDSMIVGKQVGTVLAVVAHSKNTLREVGQMEEIATKLGVAIKGYVYNLMDFKASGYGANRYYSYSYYGMSEEDVES